MQLLVGQTMEFGCGGDKLGASHDADGDKLDVSDVDLMEFLVGYSGGGESGAAEHRGQSQLQQSQYQVRLLLNATTCLRSSSESSLYCCSPSPPVRSKFFLTK